MIARETGTVNILMNNLTKHSSTNIDAGIGAPNWRNAVHSLFMPGRGTPALYFTNLNTKSNQKPVLSGPFFRPGNASLRSTQRCYAALRSAEPERKMRAETGQPFRFDYI